MADQSKRQKKKELEHQNPFEDLGGKLRRKDVYQEVDFEHTFRSTKSPIRHERIEDKKQKMKGS
jgi:hypothetical protein